MYYFNELQLSNVVHLWSMNNDANQQRENYWCKLYSLRIRPASSLNFDFKEDKGKKYHYDCLFKSDKNL